MHFCLLVGYGAGAVNPYLAYATMAGMIRDGQLRDIDEDTAVHNFVKAVGKSITKVASKMGISTTQSYRGAQIFEAIGLAQDVIDKYFTWTPSRVGGVGLDAIARETAARHSYAFKVAANLDGDLDVGGQYQWRRARRVPHVQPEHDREAAAFGALGKFPPVQGIHEGG